MKKNSLASMTLNVEENYWHNGWKTGDVLRLAHSSIKLENYLNQMIQTEQMRLAVPLDVAKTIVYHNTTRGLIELICECAKKLGYDALYGHEIDRHTDQKETLSQPLLAVFKKGMVTEPEWVTKNT